MKITSSDYLVIDHYASPGTDWLEQLDTAEKCEAMSKQSEAVVQAYFNKVQYQAKWGV